MCLVNAYEKHMLFMKSVAFHERPLARDCNPMFFIVGVGEGWEFKMTPILHMSGASSWIREEGHPSSFSLVLSALYAQETEAENVSTARRLKSQQGRTNMR